ncbi:MAG: TonB-dependent receptor [Arcobacteraceae bacterium]
MKIQKLTLSVFASCAIFSSLVYADNPTTLDSIVVTSDFRDTTLSSTSNSISVLSEEQLVNKSHQSFENVIGQIPNVNFSTGGSRAKYIQIRGIGERSQFIAPVNPSVGLILDGIDVSESALALTLFDVNQIEVLKGPQGTTFGSNAMAGVVTLKSNQPTKELEGQVEATIGNYNTKALGVAIGGTLIENRLIGRFSVYQNTSDGFMENKHLGKDDTQNIDELSTKAQLTYLASDEHTIDLNVAHIDVDNGYDAFTFDNTRNTYSDQPGTDAQETNAIAIKSTYQINNKMHLISKASFSKSDSEYGYDDDWSYIGAFSDDLWPYSAYDEYLRKRERIDIDLRLVSDEDGRIFNDTTDWTFGTYYKNQSEDLTRNYKYLPQTYKSSFDTKNLAIYGQLDSNLTNKLTLTTGLRIENWEAEFEDNDSLNIDTDEILIGGKIGLSYQENENNLYYATLSKGYKPGGVNPDNSLSNDARDFKTEHLWNIDLGKNFSYFESRLNNRINFFYGLREDQQVKSSSANVRSDGSTEFIDYYANAAKSHYYGVEVQTDYYADNSLHLFASLGLLKSNFDDYKNPDPDSTDTNGRAPAHSPEYQYNVGFDYMITDLIQIKSDVEGKDAYYFSNSHDEKSKTYALLNASISYLASDWTLTLWGKNLTDESYQTRGFYFGNNPGNGYEDEMYTQQGDPRTFGLTAKYSF